MSERETQPQITELSLITNLLPFERQGETQVSSFRRPMALIGGRI